MKVCRKYGRTRSAHRVTRRAFLGGAAVALAAVQHPLALAAATPMPWPAAIVGPADWRHILENAWHGADGVELRAMIDPLASSVERVLEQVRPRLIGLATPHWDAGLLDAALRCGARAIYCLAPLPPSVDKARILDSHCRRHGVRLAMSPWCRWDVQLATVLAMLAAGELGELLEVRAACDHMPGGNAPWSVRRQLLWGVQRLAGSPATCRGRIYTSGHPARGDAIKTLPDEYLQEPLLAIHLTLGTADAPLGHVDLRWGNELRQPASVTVYGSRATAILSPDEACSLRVRRGMPWSPQRLSRPWETIAPQGRSCCGDWNVAAAVAALGPLLEAGQDRGSSGLLGLRGILATDILIQAAARSHRAGLAVPIEDAA